MAHKTLIAEEDTLRVLTNLRAAIDDTGHSLRGLERRSAAMGLDDPESINHGNLSNILRNKGARRLSVQLLLTLCKMIGVKPVAILHGPRVGQASEIIDRLPDRDVEQWLLQGVDLLEAVNGPGHRNESLRQAVLGSAAHTSSTAKKPRTRRAPR